MRVVDSGVSTKDGPAYFGVIVENPNTDWVALGVGVDTTFLDASGKEIPASHSVGLIPTLRAGERNAVAGNSPGGAGAASIKVTVIVSDWLPLGVVPPNALSASGVSTQTSSGAMTTTGAVVNASNQPVQARLTVIYRDAGGKIIGGASDFANEYPPGDTPFEIQALEVLPVASTEAFLTY